MSMSHRSPKLIKGSIVLLDSSSGAVLRVIALQYNPASMTRSLPAQQHESRNCGDRAEPRRTKRIPAKTKFRLAAFNDNDASSDHIAGLSAVRARIADRHFQTNCKEPERFGALACV